MELTAMVTTDRTELRRRLQHKAEDLNARLARIKANLTRGLDPDSKERAKELEDSDVVNTLGIDATEELDLIRQTLRRIDDGTFGTCHNCRGAIGEERLAAWPYAAQCIDCARNAETAPVSRFGQ
ncbi:MAG: TraR/DksA C4-type zinc finger protein [Woeseia sp.]